VTVISRRFAGPTPLDKQPAWYEAAWVPVVARNVTAILIALMVLVMGVRPLSRALMKKREEAAPRPELPGIPIGPTEDAEGNPIPNVPRRPSVSIEMLDQARGYDDRIAMVQAFTRDNPTRAALAVRDMIKTDAN